MTPLESLLEATKTAHAGKVYNWNKELVEFIQSSPKDEEEIEEWLEYCSENIFLTHSPASKFFYKACKLELETLKK